MMHDVHVFTMHAAVQQFEGKNELCKYVDA